MWLKNWKLPWKKACSFLSFGKTVSKLSQKNEELSSFNWYFENEISLSPLTSHFMLMAIPIGIVVLISSLSPLWCCGSPLLHSLEIMMSFSLSSTHNATLPSTTSESLLQLKVRTTNPFPWHLFSTPLVCFLFSYCNVQRTPFQNVFISVLW